MSQKTAKSSSIHSLPRCQYFFVNGSRCRLHVPEAGSLFCPSHAKLAENPHEIEDLASLTAGLSEFKSAVPINTFLSRLLVLLSERRISPRLAAVLAYITNQLLRTLPVLDREANPHAGPAKPPIIIWDMPGPDHESSQPVPAREPKSASEPRPARALNEVRSGVLNGVPSGVPNGVLNGVRNKVSV